MEAGKDWRSLNRLAIVDGKLRDYLIVPDNRQAGFLGVTDWHEAASLVTGTARPGNGKFSVADPRFHQSDRWHDGNQLGVKAWSESAGTIGGGSTPGQGAYSVADPRHVGAPKHNNCFRVVAFNDASPSVTGGTGPSAGGLAVADPRVLHRRKGDDYLTAAHFGVVPWKEPSGTVAGAACHDNGAWSVADPRLPAGAQNLVAVIRALDDTWHRPFTTLELASLQSLVDPEEFVALDGLSDSAWRERIGNAVPPDAAQAIAGVMGTTLLLAKSGETFMLSNSPIWVRPIAVALSVQGPTP